MKIDCAFVGCRKGKIRDLHASKVSSGAVVLRNRQIEWQRKVVHD